MINKIKVISKVDMRIITFLYFSRFMEPFTTFFILIQSLPMLLNFLVNAGTIVFPFTSENYICPTFTSLKNLIHDKIENASSQTEEA